MTYSKIAEKPFLKRYWFEIFSSVLGVAIIAIAIYKALSDIRLFASIIVSLVLLSIVIIPITIFLGRKSISILSQEEQDLLDRLDQMPATGRRRKSPKISPEEYKQLHIIRKKLVYIDCNNIASYELKGPIPILYKLLPDEEVWYIGDVLDKYTDAICSYIIHRKYRRILYSSLTYIILICLFGMCGVAIFRKQLDKFQLITALLIIIIFAIYLSIDEHWVSFNSQKKIMMDKMRHQAAKCSNCPYRIDCLLENKTPKRIPIPEIS
ncbi:MAG: hypothetical protein ACYDIC_18400 [Desulfobaccales bacterium]